MDGILYGSVLPLTPALCLAPRAACNYFSTSVIYFWRWETCGVSYCVEVSLSYSVIASTSSIRVSISFRAFSWVFIEASNLDTCWWVAAVLVVLWVEEAS